MTYDSTQGNFSGGFRSLTLARLHWIGLMGQVWGLDGLIWGLKGLILGLGDHILDLGGLIWVLGD